MGARETALNVLIACRKEGGWSNGVLKEYIARDRLDRKEAALASRLCYGVLQNRYLLDHYLQPDAKRCYICIPVFSGLVFGLLPLAACFVSAMEALKLGAVGAGIFTLVTWLFSSIQDRLSTGPAAKAAPIFSAVGLYLAAQCFMGILL